MIRTLALPLALAAGAALAAPAAASAHCSCRPVRHVAYHHRARRHYYRREVARYRSPERRWYGYASYGAPYYWYGWEPSYPVYYGYPSYGYGPYYGWRRPYYRGYYRPYYHSGVTVAFGF